MSEDPYLSGKMTAADVRGIQSVDVIATIKHLAVNQHEDIRMTGSSEIDERSLNELYLSGFRIAVLEGNPLAVMTAYNKVNGSFCGSNKYLVTDVLRNQWGYKSYVMSDWYAGIDNFQQTALYGYDKNMPNRSQYSETNFQTVGEEVVNMHARRIIYASKRIGAVRSNAGYAYKAYENYYLSDDHRQVARKVGTSAIVLAKNDGNILPLPLKGAKIALTGAYADSCRNGGGGSSEVNPLICKTPREGITEILQQAGAGASTIVQNVADADYVVVFVAVTGEQEEKNRPKLELSVGNADVQAALNAKPQKTIVVYTGGSACVEGVWSTAPAILMAIYPGQEQAYCLGDILFGKETPSGKLPFTFPKNAGQLPSFTPTADKKLIYPAADVAHGYFRFNKNNEEPLFAFGHGLSYTTFSYSTPEIYPTSIVAGDRVHVMVNVTNTGSVAGREAVQLYLSLPSGKGVAVRTQELRGFDKIALDPGQTKKVHFILYSEDMAYFDNGGTDFDGDGSWKVLSGTYGVRVGTSSDKNRSPSVSGTFTVN
jgi:beta-glucosidase